MSTPRQYADSPTADMFARLADAFPHWFIMWGLYERAYWAFPCFAAVPGTLIMASGTGELMAAMRDAEHEAGLRR